MKELNLEAMPSDDLWQLYEQVGRLLTKELTSEKRKLEHRLSQLGATHSSSEKQSRPYSKIHPRTPKTSRGIDDLRIDANET
jgi:hypothetical protein